MRMALDRLIFHPKPRSDSKSSVEVHRVMRDSDESSRQIVMAKVGRDITIVGRTCRTLLDLFDLGTYLRAFVFTTPSFLPQKPWSSDTQRVLLRCLWSMSPLSAVQSIYA